ncbi:diacylglycerol kinase [candidate division WOR-3 bacterium]|nr:diacylglycerol kinase [candidate division WOR-3 bacterium]
MAQTEIGKSFFDALRGMKIAFKTQKHLHLHIFIFMLALYSIAFGGANLRNSLALLAVATMVVTAELINSSIEILCDFISPEHNAFIKNAKDLSAGAVLSATFSSIIFAYLILADAVMISIARFSGFITKIPPLYLLLFLLLFCAFTLILSKRFYGKFSIPFEGTTFALSLLITFLSLKSLSVTFVFFMLIGGIILIEALLRNKNCENVYISGLMAIIAAVFIHRISANIEIQFSNDLVASFLIGASPTNGSCYIASLKPSLSSSVIAIFGEIASLVFFTIWGPRFKNSFAKNKTNHSFPPPSKFFYLGLFVASALPMPFSSSVVSSSYSTAFSCDKKLSVPISTVGILLKYFLVIISLPPYARIGV